MVTYVLVFGEPPEEGLAEILKRHWPKNSYQITDTVALVRESNGDSETNTNSIAEVAGMRSESDKTVGVVFRASPFYSGYHNVDLWEWLADANDGT